jgi:hypothetical protein
MNSSFLLYIYHRLSLIHYIPLTPHRPLSSFQQVFRVQIYVTATKIGLVALYIFLGVHSSPNTYQSTLYLPL